MGRESEFRDMNQFSGIGAVSLEFQKKESYRQFWNKSQVPGFTKIVSAIDLAARRVLNGFPVLWYKILF
jgi:hypothetical protein